MARVVGPPPGKNLISNDFGLYADVAGASMDRLKRLLCSSCETLGYGANGASSLSIAASFSDGTQRWQTSTYPDYFNISIAHNGQLLLYAIHIARRRGRRDKIFSARRLLQRIILRVWFGALIVEVRLILCRNWNSWRIVLLAEIRGGGGEKDL